jgi:putative two-component system response regulator
MALMNEAKAVVACHHEKVDGSGYPAGLEGDEIPLLARIFALAEVFDALTSERPYKKAFSYEEAIGTLRFGSGTHFDQRILEVFVTISRP